MKLFVYGTLRSGFQNYAARRLHSRGRYIGTAVIRARLCPLGRYQALRPGWGRVRGEVYSVPLHLLRYLDVYEGSAYRRAIAFAKFEDGKFRRTFVYMMAE